MQDNLLRAIEVLKSGDFTLAMVSDENIITKKERGVKPLLELINDNNDYSDYCAADKVIGRAAAFLYVILNVKTIHCGILSENAARVFSQYNISYSYDKIVPYIENRQKNGVCPMETATLNCEDPHEALECIKVTLKELMA